MTVENEKTAVEQSSEAPSEVMLDEGVEPQEEESSIEEHQFDEEDALLDDLGQGEKESESKDASEKKEADESEQEEKSEDSSLEAEDEEPEELSPEDKGEKDLIDRENALKGRLGRYDKYAEKKGYKSAEDMLDVLVSHEQLTEEPSSHLDVYFKDSREKLTEFEKNLKERLDSGDIGEGDYYAHQLNARQEIYEGALRETVKDVLNAVERTLGKKVDNIYSQYNTNRLMQEWEKLPEATRQRYADIKGEVISHIAADEKLSSSQKPFVAGLSSYIAKKAAEDSSFAEKFLSGKTFNAKAQEIADKKLKEARKEAAKGIGKSAKAESKKSVKDIINEFDNYFEGA